MSTAEEFEGPGTQPASLEDLEELDVDSASTVRPMATQAVFRPHFDDSDGASVGTADTEPEDQVTAMTRALSPTRRLGGGLVEIPRVREIDPLVRADDQSRCRGVETVLLELRQAGRQVVGRR